MDKREKRVSRPGGSRGACDTPLSLTTNEKKEVSLMKLLQVQFPSVVAIVVPRDLVTKKNCQLVIKSTV